MKVVVTGHRVRLEEPEEFARFELVAEPGPAGLESVLSAAGAGHLQSEDQAAISTGFILREAGSRVESTGWRHGFDAMVKYAEGKGWLTPSGEILAHITWTARGRALTTAQPRHRIAVAGLGEQGTGIATLICALGHTLVGVADPGPRAGRPIAEFVPTYPGRDAVRRSITELLDDSTATPDLVVVAAAVPLQAMLDLAGEVIDRGIDVITLHQDLFSYGASWTPDLHARAVAGGATVMGTGIQDTWWVQLLTLAASGVDAITKITLTNVVPLETLSWGIGEEIGVALSSEEFEAHVRTTAEHPSVIGAPLVDAVQRMGAQAGPLTKSVEPVFGADPYVWSAAGRVLHPGETQGAIERVTFDTDSGFRVEGIISVLPGGAETATGEITIEGVPTTRVAFGPLSKDSTNTALVSRIPDVISAPPGVIFARDLAPARHQFRQRTD